MYQHSKLKNGINLITVPVAGTQALTVLAMFPIGSRYETATLSGAAHFVEHMLFKGTKQRPTAQDISRSLDAVGAEYNAFTYKEYTGYYVKIDAAKQEVAFDLVADMLFNSVLDGAEVEKEKGAIVEELRMYKDNPSMAIDILADKLVYGDNPLGWDIGGSETTVRGMTREALWKFYQQHYSAKNMVLVVAGNINRRNLAKMTAYFSKHTSPQRAAGSAFYKKEYKPFAWSAKKVSLRDRIAVEVRPVDQAQAVLTFPGIKTTDSRRYALSVLATILGGGMSSRLFVEVREKRGLAYMVRAGTSYFRDSGLCYIQAGLDPKRFGEAMKVIRAEVARIVNEDVSATELRDAKNNITGHLALSLEDSSAQAEWYAKQFFFQAKPNTPADVAAQIQKVTAKQVRELAKELLDWDTMRLAVIGPDTKETIVSLLA